jgi:hypothetical protein
MCNGSLLMRSSVAYDSTASFNTTFQLSFPVSLVNVFKHHLYTITDLHYLLPAPHSGTQWIAIMAYTAGLVLTWEPKKTNFMTGRRPTNFDSDI